MIEKTSLRAALAVAGFALMTSGCGIGKALGGGKQAPDEFAIATLSLIHI